MRNDFDSDFEILERHNNEHAKKRIIKISILAVALIAIATLVLNLFDSDDESEVPMIESHNSQIKEAHNINDDIVIENLDMEVYDNITSGADRDYSNIGVIEKQKFTDEQLQTEKEAAKEEKSVQTIQKLQANEQEKEKQYSELNTELSNSDLVNNIKVGKDVKPSIKIQLSASSSEVNAEKHWNTISKQYPDLFKNKYHFVDVLDLGVKGKFYRLQIGYFASNSDAKKFCNDYIIAAKKNSTDCIVVQSK